MTLWFAEDSFTPEERELLSHHVTDPDGPVFGLVNLPEVVKGALFARYSRTPKSLKRLFLDEFADIASQGRLGDVGVAHAEQIYERIFLEYGDDSVAQLGGVHLACEQASQLLCKQLEWGRLAAYLEQSTRYIPYDDKPGGRYRYAIPPEIEGTSLRERYVSVMDEAFSLYAKWLEPMQAFFRERHPKDPADPDGVYRATIRAKACDTLRGMLPAATRSNVGIYATGQSYEQLLLRLRAHPLAEMRDYADLMLRELRKVIPAFLVRVDAADRGVAWSDYLAETALRTSQVTGEILRSAGVTPAERAEVTLTDFDPEGEAKVVAAAMYAVSDLPDDQLRALVGEMPVEERSRILEAYVGSRHNRRHKPGRAFERTDYRFDILCDYGAFRDLQRHRMLTIEWQPLSTAHGVERPAAIDEAGAGKDWDRVMNSCASLSEHLAADGLAEAAQYAVPMAYRIRFVLQLNAREAVHLCELRSSPQGHPAYRRIAQEMARAIGETAGHTGIASAMTFVDHSDVDLERLDAERRTAAKRVAAEAAQASDGA